MNQVNQKVAVVIVAAAMAAAGVVNNG